MQKADDIDQNVFQILSGFKYLILLRLLL